MSERASGSRRLYVYGVIRAGQPVDLSDGGLGAVRVVSSATLAALCSEVGAQPLGRRRELKAHADVLAAACLQTAVVPFAFGTVLADDDEVRTTLLDRHSEHLAAELTRLRDVLQFNVRLVPDEARILGEIVAGSIELRRLRDAVAGLPPGTGQAQRLKLGEAVAGAYRRAGEDIGRSVIGALASRAVDVRVEELGGPEATTRAAVLVLRDRVDDFLGEAQRAAEALHGRATCRVVGPLPPFTFVESFQLDAPPSVARAGGR